MKTQRNAQAELAESLGRSSRIGIARSWVVAGLALTGTMTAWAESESVHSPWVHRATKVAPADENQQVTIALHLKLRNETALVQLIKQLYDPASSQYGRFLTSAQFRAQFAPTAGDAQAVADVLAQ
jgi:hypothetical protein